MVKTILITGATDGIGLETARVLRGLGHHLVLHGRHEGRLEKVRAQLLEQPGDGSIHCLRADLSQLSAVEQLAWTILEQGLELDVLINNAGVMRLDDPWTPNGLDRRFVVNTLAPYWLTRRLLPHLAYAARVINLSSAAQAPVDPAALSGERRLSDDMSAYAQSKLALTMWTGHLARIHPEQKRVFVAVNPGSLLASKMVREGFGIAGKSLSIGADALVRAALGEEFAQASGLYFDNDIEGFGSPHPDALDAGKCQALVGQLDSILARELPGVPVAL